MTPARIALMFLVVALGCRKAPGDQDPVLLRVTLDGAEVSRVRGSELRSDRLLVHMLPADAQDTATWARWIARSADGRALTIEDPTEDYDDHDVVLRLERNQVQVAIMRRAHPGDPPHLQAALRKPEESLVGAVTIAIETAAGSQRDGGVAPAAGPRPAADLVIVRGGTSQVLASAALDQLALTPDQPGHAKDGGWILRDVLAAAGVSGAPDIVATGREGNMTVRGADLGAAGARVMLRRNRRGQLRLTVEREGAAAVVLHAVVRLEIIQP